MKLIKPYGVASGSPAVHCGVILQWIPDFDGDAIAISGTAVLRRSTNRKADRSATQFEANENLINLTLKEGKPGYVPLAGGGRMLLTATVIDPSTMRQRR